MLKKSNKNAQANDVMELLAQMAQAQTQTLDILAKLDARVSKLENRNKPAPSKKSTGVKGTKGKAEQPKPVDVDARAKAVKQLLNPFRNRTASAYGRANGKGALLYSQLTAKQLKAVSDGHKADGFASLLSNKDYAQLIAKHHITLDELANAF